MTARSHSNFPLAQRLARTALEADGGFDAASLIGQLHWYQKRPAEADSYLQSVTPLAVTDAQKAQLASARIEVLDLGMNDAEAALKVAEMAEISIADEAYRDQIAAERARILGRGGHNEAAVAIVQPLIGRATGRTLISACFAAATSMAVTGQCKQGMEAVELGYATHKTLAGPPVGFPPELHRSLGCGVLGHAGFLEDAWQLGSAEYARALTDHSPLAIGFLAGFLALISVHQGRCRAAERFAGEALIVFFARSVSRSWSAMHWWAWPMPAHCRGTQMGHTGPWSSWTALVCLRPTSMARWSFRPGRGLRWPKGTSRRRPTYCGKGSNWPGGAAPADLSPGCYTTLSD